eukprot:g2450.t1
MQRRRTRQSRRSPGPRVKRTPGSEKQARTASTSGASFFAALGAALVVVPLSLGWGSEGRWIAGRSAWSIESPVSLGACGENAVMQVAVSAGVAWLGAALMAYAIPRVVKRFPEVLRGRDMGKLDKTEIPEGVGIVTGAGMLVCMVICQRFYLDGGGGDALRRLAEYNSSLLSISIGLLLGFVDDVLDLPWRYKLLGCAAAASPLLLSYGGTTDIILPKVLRPMLYDASDGALTSLGTLVSAFAPVDVASAGAIVSLGLFYQLYMYLLSVFLINCINIYAGINGLEAAQSAVIAVAIIIMNVLELVHETDRATFTGNDDHHLLSLMIMLPFFATTMSLLYFNWFPARVFVGDTFTHFAGMTFAVAAILGHFSKTLLLLFVPQIANFAYSLPQLVGAVPCPRHRLPNFNRKTGLMEPSCVAPGDPRTNMTLINAVLRVFGPMKEQTLCIVLVALQVGTCAAGLAGRYMLAEILY